MSKKIIVLVGFIIFSAFISFNLFCSYMAYGAQEKKEVALDFDDVDIRLFIRVISELTGKNFIIDNNVRGKVTVISTGVTSNQGGERGCPADTQSRHQARRGRGVRGDSLSSNP